MTSEALGIDPKVVELGIFFFHIVAFGLAEKLKCGVTYAYVFLY